MKLISFCFAMLISQTFAFQQKEPLTIWMIGDSTVDLETARNAGIRAVLVRTGHGGRDRRWPGSTMPPWQRAMARQAP